jgi:hypothetical protein
MAYIAAIMVSKPPLDEPCDAVVIDAPPSAARAGGWRDVVDHRWLVLALLFFVTAALGLPLLWASRAFSLPAKLALTFVVLAWTALVLWLFLLIMIWCYGQIAPALAGAR